MDRYTIGNRNYTTLDALVAEVRDPAIDPRPGDVVRSTVSKSVRERHVKERRGNDIWYLACTGSAPSRERLCWITTWQDWCRANRVTSSFSSKERE